MGLLDLVEEQGPGAFRPIIVVPKKPAFTDPVAHQDPESARIHELGHIETDEFFVRAKEVLREQERGLGLTYTGWAQEEHGCHGSPGKAKVTQRALKEGYYLRKWFILAENT
jgi:hypothetical protein